MSKKNFKIGIMGGSGLYQMDDLKNVKEIIIETPFGSPSDALITGELNDIPVVFLARHGRGHYLLPSELPFRANIYAMKSLGVEFLISVSAVGSLKEEHKPLDIVIPDQFFDHTSRRSSECTFFGNGIVGHITFADPVCSYLCDVLEKSGQALDNIEIHRGGTYLCIEGPSFSTRAESNIYRSWGMDVIGMTNLHEAKLAREAEMSYATLAMVTDYDCWHESHDAVTVDLVIENLNKNVATAQQIIRNAVQQITKENIPSPHSSALKHAIMTRPEKISITTRQRLALIIGKYFPEENTL